MYLYFNKSHTLEVGIVRRLKANHNAMQYYCALILYLQIRQEFIRLGNNKHAVLIANLCPSVMQEH